MSTHDDRRGLDAALVGLVRVRAAQLRGCSHCLDLRTHEERARGEREERLFLLGVWHAAPCYTAAERAALAFCEAVAAPRSGPVSDAVLGDLRRHVDCDDIAILTRILAEDGASGLVPVQRSTLPA